MQAGLERPGGTGVRRAVGNNVVFGSPWKFMKREIVAWAWTSANNREVRLV